MLNRLFCVVVAPRIGQTKWPNQDLSITGSDAQAATRIWEDLKVQDWLEAFEHHPRIGDRQALAARFASTRNWSANEQAGVEVAEEDILDRLASGNENILSDLDTSFWYVLQVSQRLKC